jgi:predicted XRE-type DNA-binding protein
MNKEIKFTKGSGNVYKDLGFEDAEIRFAKAKLVSKLNQLLDKKKLTKIKAAKILGINQPKVSALINGRLTDFSIERLIGFLNKLDQDVKIVISGKPKKRKIPAGFEVAFA